MNIKGQGAAEYLLLLVGAILIATIVLFFLANFVSPVEHRINEYIEKYEEITGVNGENGEPVGCGDGIMDAGEECDKTDFGIPPATCADYDFFAGSLTCVSCVINTSNCHNCGNNEIDNGEVCDPPGEQGGCLEGQLCNVGCTGCYTPDEDYCGDGKITVGEICDPPGEQGGCLIGWLCNWLCTACYKSGGGGGSSGGGGGDGGSSGDDVPIIEMKWGCTTGGKCEMLVAGDGVCGGDNRNCLLCGDGDLDYDEECDLTSEEPNHGCAVDELCNSDCTCEPLSKAVPYCGDGVMDPGEECEPPGSMGPDNGCAEGEYCDECICGPVPKNTEIEHLAVSYDDGLGDKGGLGLKVYCLANALSDPPITNATECHAAVSKNGASDSFIKSLYDLPDGDFDAEGNFTPVAIQKYFVAAPESFQTGFMREDAFFAWNSVVDVVNYNWKVDVPLLWSESDYPSDPNDPDHWPLLGSCPDGAMSPESGHCFSPLVVYLNRRTWNQNDFKRDADQADVVNTYFSASVQPSDGTFKDPLLYIGRNTIPNNISWIDGVEDKIIEWDGIIGAEFYGIDVYSAGATYSYEGYDPKLAEEDKPILRLRIDMNDVDKMCSGLTRTGEYPWRYSLNLKEAEVSCYLPGLAGVLSVWQYLMCYLVNTDVEVGVRACAIRSAELKDLDYPDSPESGYGSNAPSEYWCAWDLEIIHLPTSNVLTGYQSNLAVYDKEGDGHPTPITFIP